MEGGWEASQSWSSVWPVLIQVRLSMPKPPESHARVRPGLPPRYDRRGAWSAPGG